MLINNCFGLLKIIGIFENFQNCGIIPNLLICEFLRICRNIFRNFIVENLLFSNIEIIRIVGKFQNCGIISNLLICEFLRICWNIFDNFIVENLFYWIIGNVGIVGTVGRFWDLWHDCNSNDIGDI